MSTLSIFCGFNKKQHESVYRLVKGMPSGTSRKDLLASLPLMKFLEAFENSCTDLHPHADLLTVLRLAAEGFLLLWPARPHTIAALSRLE